MYRAFNSRFTPGQKMAAKIGTDIAVSAAGALVAEAVVSNIVDKRAIKKCDKIKDEIDTSDEEKQEKLKKEQLKYFCKKLAVIGATYGAAACIGYECNKAIDAQPSSFSTNPSDYYQSYI